MNKLIETVKGISDRIISFVLYIFNKTVEFYRVPDILNKIIVIGILLNVLFIIFMIFAVYIPQ